METRPAELTFWRRFRSLLAAGTPNLFPLGLVVDGDRITYHKHWFVLFRSLALPLLCLVLASAVLFGAFSLLRPISSPFVSVFALATWVLAFFWLLWRYENWRNDFYVVGKDRILDVYRLPLGMRTELREAPLANIQNLSLRLPNFLAVFFDYGDVMIDTAGKQGQLVFQSVASPKEVLAEISARVDAFRAEKAARERQQRDGEMLQWLTAYAELGRIVILRNPHTVAAGAAVEVEWRISGPPASVESCLRWDVEARPDRDYRSSTELQQGGVGNFLASFSAPLADKLHFAVFARIDGAEYWSLPHIVAVRG